MEMKWLLKCREKIISAQERDELRSSDQEGCKRKRGKKEGLCM